MRIRFGILLLVCLWLFGWSFQLVTAANDAKLSLAATYKKYAVGNIVNVKVMLDSGSPVNIIDGQISFNKSAFTLVGVDREKSFASFWLKEPKYKSGVDKIEFTAGQVYPGFKGKAELFNISLKIKDTKNGWIKFEKEQVLAADGNGTKVNATTTVLNLVIDKGTQVTEEKDKNVLATGLTKFTVYSRSHPQNKWSNSNNVSMYWTVGYQVKYLFDAKPKTDPGKGALRIKSANFSTKTDGVYYFHLRAVDSKGGSKLSHYKVQIDTKKPSNFFTIIDPPKNIGGKLNISVKAVDSLSGIDYYLINIDGVKIKTINNNYQTVIKTSGKHSASVRAYDRAGNFVESTSSFNVK